MQHSLYIKNFTSSTPCSCALKFLTLELNDSADALVDLSIKIVEDLVFLQLNGISSGFYFPQS